MFKSGRYSSSLVMSLIGREQLITPNIHAVGVMVFFEKAHETNILTIKEVRVTLYLPKKKFGDDFQRTSDRLPRQIGQDWNLRHYPSVVPVL